MNYDGFLKDYLYFLKFNELPLFLVKYLSVPSLVRLKKIGYFCGMDYASKDIYDFGSYVSRYDHSLTTALLTWRCSNDKKATIAALFHDCSTPCFSHVIDYMNKDYATQESTEEKTEFILKNDSYFANCLKEDNIFIDEVSDFKKFSIVDLDRPMLCADRIDGIILTSLFWPKSINISEVEEIVNSIEVYKNEFDQFEMGFNNVEVAKMVFEKNDIIDLYCHTKEDNYMMELLADITRVCISNNYFSYDDLYFLDESLLVDRILNSGNSYLLDKWHLFQNITKDKIGDIELPFVKKRVINPLVNGKRLY